MNDQPERSLRTAGVAETGRAETTVHASGAAVVQVRGEHDLGTVPVLVAALEQGCAHARVVVDLTGCTFIDSTVVAALVKAARAVTERGDAFAVVVPPGQANVARVAQIVQLGDLMSLHDSLEAAFARLREREALPGAGA